MGPSGRVVGPAAVLVDGRVVGTWRRDGIELFEPVGEDVLAALDAERADVERYLGVAR